MVDGHQIILGTWSGSRRNVTIEFYDGAQKVYELSFFGNPDDFNDTFAQGLYASVNYQLAERELEIAKELIGQRQNPDTITTYMNQVEFDRRLLGYIMTLVDCHQINACLPFWSAVQPRNGNNTAQRASNLGVVQAEYEQVEDRFNLYFGASTFLTDDLAAVWQDTGAWG